ncbi:MAG: DUF3987 domain-containing protein [Candidatus Competibacter sp.]|nr:DUF3987 domain-containing protein [Candidatus Competibacter sp.]
MSLILKDASNRLAVESIAQIQDAFRQHVTEKFIDPGAIEPNGRFHTFRTPGDAESDRKNGKAGYCCIDPARLVGVFGSYRPGECPATVIEFQLPDGQSPTDAERAAIMRRLREEQARLQEEAANRASKAWEAGHGLDHEAAHLYLQSRGVSDIAKATGIVLIHGKTILLAPMIDAAGKLWNLQRIDPTGRKRFLDHGRTAGLAAWIPSPPAAGRRWFVTEGIAKALAVYGATDAPVLCAYSAGNLMAAIEEHGNGRELNLLTLAADNDPAGRTVVEQAQRRWPMIQAIYPPDGVGDWNDILVQHGMDALKARLAGPVLRQEPDPLRRDPLPAESFPVDALGDVLGGAVAAIRRIVQAPDALIAQSVLAAAALSVQPHANLIIDGRVSPLSLFCITVGASGERKTAVDALAVKPVADRQRELVAQYRDDDRLHKREIKEYERIEREAIKEKVVDLAAIKANREQKKAATDALGEPPQPPLLPNLLAADPTAEGLFKLFANGQPSLGLFSDEGALFVGGAALMKETRLRTIGALSKLWDGRPLDRVRSGDGASLLFDRRLALHLMMQPLVAAELFGDPIYADQGFLSRVLCAWPESTAGTRRYVCADATQDPAVTRYWATLKTLLEWPYPLREGTRNELTPRNLPLTEPAKAAWIRYSDAIEEQLGDGQPLEPIRGFANKAAEHAARIAGVLAVIENPDIATIGLPHIEAAIALLDYYLTETLRIQDSGAGSPDLRLAERLLLWARDKDTVHLRQIYQYGPNGIRDSDTARRITGILERHRWFVKKPDGVVVDGIRHREAWTVWREFP